MKIICLALTMVYLCVVAGPVRAQKPGTPADSKPTVVKPGAVSNGKKPVVKKQQPADYATDPAYAKVVELHTFGCFGYCPVFNLLVKSNLNMDYEGLMFVTKTGKSMVRISKSELASIQKAVNAANLWQYPDTIKSNIVDAPFASMVVFEGSKSKMVFGSIDRPRPVLELETVIRNIAEAHGLKVKEGVPPTRSGATGRKKGQTLTAGKAEDESTVAVQLNPKSNAGVWIKQYNADGLKLGERLSTSRALFAVRFDPKKMTRKAVIDLLGKSKEVVAVKAIYRN